MDTLKMIEFDVDKIQSNVITDKKKYDLYQNADNEIERFKYLVITGVIDNVSKDERLEMKQAFVNGLAMKNKLMMDYRKQKENIENYNMKHYGKKSLQLKFWDETITC